MAILKLSLEETGLADSEDYFQHTKLFPPHKQRYEDGERKEVSYRLCWALLHIGPMAILCTHYLCHELHFPGEETVVQ